MVGISKLYCGSVEPSDVLRYGRESGRLPSHLLQFSKDKRPVVVWNCTKRCNLSCKHCYSSSNGAAGENELSTEEGRELIGDLASFGAPVMLFSGGEPLLREDLPLLVEEAVSRGMRAVISTNGTLIDREIAARLKERNLSYVGVSLDGMEEVNDRFRGVTGAFQQALAGIRHCREAGIKVGLRFTINRYNFRQIPDIFALMKQEGIPRVCFYHLVYSGRGSFLKEESLSHEESREVVDLIIDETIKLKGHNPQAEVLTVDNHCDAPYLYMRMLRENHPRSSAVKELLEYNRGNSSGHGIGCVSWDGEVYADQFWRHRSFGNVRVRPFSEIWTDLTDPLMKKLKDKKSYVKGRCAACRWLSICGGNFRVRAEAVTGDLWAPDPACYLTDEEIGS